ncbi:MAG: hypothetical protein JRH10_16820 [Deltaproteobacteria bacterium]|nr:hypothetical protein [Deltaproteobacteria bacterium]MBW2444634.1 hypothetical protein [Deltaproteobacteria bacterium]
MQGSKHAPTTWRTLLGIAAAVAFLGCGSIAKFDRDLDTHPITDTGVAATIIMPGGGIPMPNRTPYGGLAPPSAGQAAQTATNQPGTPGSGSSSSSGAGAGPSGGGGMVMIGGTSQDIEKHQKVNNEPAWAKAIKLPFLVAAYPFKKAHQAMTGPPDPTVQISGPPPQAPPTREELEAQREQALLEGMANELSQQGPSEPRQPSAPAYAPPVAPRHVATPAPSGAGRPSIAAELAALRLGMASTPAPVTPTLASAPAAQRQAPPPALEQLYESVDRDADGRADQWIYRTGRDVTAEATDDDGDGRPERTVRFVAGTREPATDEEDTDADGRMDTFTEYKAGRVARRKADTDGDGEIDTWSFYAAGQLLRHEQDSDGDGFRDHMSFFEDGRLVREEEDRDGNGRPDRVTHFDADERIARREEDTNRDDVMDVQSFYQEGKLRRREMIR